MSKEYLEETPTAIAGVTHCNEDGTSRQKILEYCKVHKIGSFELEREPNNKFDPNAVAVVATLVSKRDPSVTKRVKVGYIRNRRWVCVVCGMPFEPSRGEEPPAQCECGCVEFERDGLATRVAEAMDSGITYAVKVEQYTGGDGTGDDGKPKNIGCNIRIVRISKPLGSSRKK